MNSKILGYIITTMGLVIFVISFQTVQTVLKLKIPAGLSTDILTIIAIAVLAVGLFFVVKTSSSGKIKEVPIYHGKDIVGFRRVKK